MKESFWYRVKGTVNCVHEEGFYEAHSARQACYKFCRDHGLSNAANVPGLSATNVNDKTDTFYAANNGYLND